jgi:hypothetical protein
LTEEPAAVACARVCVCVPRAKQVPHTVTVTVTVTTAVSRPRAAERVVFVCDVDIPCKTQDGHATMTGLRPQCLSRLRPARSPKHVRVGFEVPAWTSEGGVRLSACGTPCPLSGEFHSVGNPRDINALGQWPQRRRRSRDYGSEVNAHAYHPTRRRYRRGLLRYTPLVVALPQFPVPSSHFPDPRLRLQTALPTNTLSAGYTICPSVQPSPLTVSLHDTTNRHPT